jgi:threonine/homoserine/homoserine lactone efflux protein
MPAAGPLVVLSLSFVTSLSGALMPGPLFTYTIARTLGTRRRAWLTGARVIAGHAAIEVLLLCGLVLGVVEFLRAPLAAKIIGVAGAALLFFMGYSLIRETARGKGLVFADAAHGDSPPETVEARGGFISRLRPPVAGILVTMGNPYWWVWWITIGAAFLVRFDISFRAWPLLLAFFVGHELGDLGWYLAVSTVLSLGRKTLPRALITGLLGACGVVIIGFGAWLGVSPFLSH